MLKASVGAELFDEEWHPVSKRDANSTGNAAVRANMCRCDTIDLRYEGHISEYLWELGLAGFSARDYTWNLKSGDDAKISQFRLKDNYVRFYLKYIKANLGKIARHSYALK